MVKTLADPFHSLAAGCVTDVWNPLTFFPHPALSTVPLPIGLDNQWWRDLLRDLGPVHRWRYSKHFRLKAESIDFPPSHFLSFSDLFILSSAWLHHKLPSCHHANTFVSAWLTHPLSLIIMLTLLCHFHLLLQTLPPQLHSLYMQPHSPYLHISFYTLTGPKESLTYLYWASPADVP